MADPNKPSPIQIALTDAHSLSDSALKFLQEIETRLDPILAKNKTGFGELIAKGEEVAEKSEHFISLESLKDKLAIANTKLKSLLGKIQI